MEYVISLLKINLLKKRPPDVELFGWRSRRAASGDHLQLAAKCIEEVQRSSSSLKIYHLQCLFLVTKLTTTVHNAREHIRENFNAERVHECRDICKQLNRVSLEVRRLVHYCCKNRWIQAAVLLGDQMENVSLLAFDLELCVKLLQHKSDWNAVAPNVLDEMGSARAEQYEDIKIKADLDGSILLKKLRMQPGNLMTKESRLAHYVAKRLEFAQNLNISSSHHDHGINTWEVGSDMIEGRSREPIGKGSCAPVHRATWLKQDVAVKTFSGTSEQMLDTFMKEVSILARLSHPNIVPMLCYAINSGRRQHSFSVVMELMDGSLHQLIDEKMENDATLVAPFDLLEAVDIMLQIAEGMHYLHEKNVVHRDLKSMNILVKHVQRSSAKLGYMQVKVADFGTSKVKEMSCTLSSLTLNMGTTRWMAPELFSNTFQRINSDHVNVTNYDSSSSRTGIILPKYPFKCDVYSFGMVCYEILKGDVPFANIPPEKVRKKVIKGLRPILPAQCPQVLTRMIEKCWDLCPDTRPTFAEICFQLRHLKCMLMIDVGGIISTHVAQANTGVTNNTHKFINFINETSKSVVLWDIKTGNYVDICTLAVKGPQKQHMVRLDPFSEEDCGYMITDARVDKPLFVTKEDCCLYSTIKIVDNRFWGYHQRSLKFEC